METNKKTTLEAPQAETLLHKKLSFAATEAYKLLRTNLSFTLPESDKNCRVIGVISSIRGEGKSTTSINLSYTLAETGKRVLLIDADLRLPSVAKKLEMRQVPGLSDVLVGSSELSDAIEKSQELENWHVLSSGSIPPNPTEMLGSSHMVRLIENISENYDFIILDLPPVNIVPDALIVSPIVDGMVLVVRENLLERRELNKCIRQLELSDVKVLGFVMNATKEDRSSYSHYRRYKRDKYYKYYNYKHYRYGGDYAYGQPADGGEDDA